MTKYLTTLAVVLVLLGCGSEGGGTGPIGPSGTGGTSGTTGTGGTANPAKTSADYLVGNWFAMDSSSCGSFLDFSADGNYTSGVACVLTDGTKALMVDSGTYYVTGGRITWMSIKSTCAERSTMPFYVDFTATETALSMSYSDALVVYVRNTSTGTTTGIVATYGCFRSGVFTASPFAILAK